MNANVVNFIVKKETGNIWEYQNTWEYKVIIYAIIANFVFL